MGQIITYYSYKGGVGRSMALVNAATLLSYWGHKVLVVDWDLEAPGLENFFNKYIDIEKVKGNLGLIDLLLSRADGKDEDYKQFVNPITFNDLGRLPFNRNAPKTRSLDFISAGKRDEHYFSLVRNFDIDNFYENNSGGQVIEDLRNQWKADYDFVLIDSRTGVTDIAGICTVQMPDMLVLLFTATRQGFDGIIKMAKNAHNAQKNLPYDRFRLLILPLATRFDYNEFELYQSWMDRFAEELSFVFESWLPASVSRKEFLERTSIPYTPYFSYGEKIAVIEEGINNPKSMGYAYETTTSILANQFEDIEDFIRNRDQFVSEINKSYMIAPKVFLSYSRKDREIAKKIYSELSSNAIDVWYDETSLSLGMNWQNEIHKAIMSSNYFLVLLDSSLVNKKDFFNYELDLILNSLHRSKVLVPVFLDKDLDKDSLPGKLSSINGINLYETNINEAIKQIIHSVKSPSIP